MNIPSPEQLHGLVLGERCSEATTTLDCNRLQGLLAAAADPTYRGSSDDLVFLTKHRFLSTAYSLAHRGHLHGESAALASLFDFAELPRLASELNGIPQPTGAVSVYVPCYNGAQYLPATIAAIQAQSYPIQRLVVVDDGSTDSSAAVAQELGAEVIQHSSNRGLAAARNTALAQIESEFVAALDADTAPHPFWLERLMQIAQGKIGIALGGRLIERHSASIPNRWRSRIMRQHGGTQPTTDGLLFGCNSVGRTAELRRCGGYSEQFRVSFEDVDFTRRFIAAGNHTLYNPDALCWHGRTDSLNSVLSTAYNWRSPPFIEKGCFQLLPALCAKWTNTVQGDTEELSTLVGEGRTELLIVSFLHTLFSIATDLFRFEAGSEADRRALQSYGILLLARAVGRARGLKAATRSLAGEVLATVCTTHRATDLEQRALSQVRSPNSESPEQLRADWASGLSPSYAALLELALGDFDAVLYLSEHILVALEEGARLVELERNAGDVALPFPRSCFSSGSRGGVSLSDFEWLEMIAGTTTGRVMLNTEGVDASSAAILLLRLAERAPTLELNLSDWAHAADLQRIVALFRPVKELRH